MLETIARDLGYKSFVDALFALLDGKHFDTGARRFAEYVQKRCDDGRDAGWRYSLSQAIVTVLEHVSLPRLFTSFAEVDTDLAYGRQEFVALCKDVKSPEMAQVLNQLRIKAVESRQETAFVQTFGETLVDCIKSSMSSGQSVDLALKLSSDPRYAKFGAILYFALLHRAQTESYGALPIFISRFQMVKGDIEQKFLKKQLDLTFKNVDLNVYLNRMPDRYLTDFLKIIYVTELAQSYHSVTTDAEITGDADLPPSRGHFDTTSSGPLEVLASAPSRAWTLVRTQFIAADPRAVKVSLAQLADALQ